jgi:hypothetical protein
MTDRAYGYFKLQLFDGAIELPLKLCTSYPGEDSMRSNVLTRTGVDGRPTNRIFVLAKKGCESKIKDVKDIERVLQWGEWETYLNTGTVTKPELEPLDKYEGVAELLAQDKERSKERDITCSGIYPMSKLKPKNYNGRHFHSYPHTEKDKTNEKWHNIYRLLALYLKGKESFLMCTFFSKGEEIGALYEEDGVLKIAGLYADKDLKPIATASILKFPITKGLQKVVDEKFSKLEKEDNPELVLEWRDYVCETLECKGVAKVKKLPTKKKVVNEEELDKDLRDMFAGL